MSIADTQRTKALERKVEELEARILMLEMQKRPVEAVSRNIQAIAEAETRKTITLRGRAA